MEWRHLDAYMMAWAAIDKAGAGVMKTDDELREMLRNLPQPLKREDLDDQAVQEIAGASIDHQATAFSVVLLVGRVSNCAICRARTQLVRSRTDRGHTVSTRSSST